AASSSFLLAGSTFVRTGAGGAPALCGAQHAAEPRHQSAAAAAALLLVATQLPCAHLQHLDELGAAAERVGDRTTPVERQRGHELPAHLGHEHLAAGHVHAL